MSNNNRPTSLLALVLFTALIALATGVAGAAESPSAAVTAPVTSLAVSPADPPPAALQTPLALTPPPVFLTTYLCSYEITACGASGLYCSVVCNVGQSCHCSLLFGHLPDGSCYVQRVGPGICF
ncbi:MAG: hypothetical protein WAM82_14595 [Thermoanaerobaculia bacterium]